MWRRLGIVLSTLAMFACCSRSGGNGNGNDGSVPDAGGVECSMGVLCGNPATCCNLGADSTVKLLVINGKDCTEQLAIPTSHLSLAHWSGVAVGNLDGDSELEILASVRPLGLVALDHDGTIQWSQSDVFWKPANDSLTPFIFTRRTNIS